MIKGIGTDIVEVGRMEQAIEKHGSRFAERILTPTELQQFQQHSLPGRFLAKRFAVKEAAAKALGTGFAKGVSWQHVSVANDSLGAPFIELSGKALELAQQKGIEQVHVSISDEHAYAVAFVIMEGSAAKPDSN